MATSTTTRLDPKRRHVVPAYPRAPSLRPSIMSDRDVRGIGTTARSTATSREMEHPQPYGKEVQSKLAQIRHALHLVGRNKAREKTHAPSRKHKPEGATSPASTNPSVAN